MIVGGDRMEYEGDPSSPVVSLLNTKLFLNSVISDAYKGVRFATTDIKKTLPLESDATIPIYAYSSKIFYTIN